MFEETLVFDILEVGKFINKCMNLFIFVQSYINNVYICAFFLTNLPIIVQILVFLRLEIGKCIHLFSC